MRNNIQEAIKWLEAEYPRGVDLVYVDRSDNYNDNPKALLELLIDGGENDEDWIMNSQWDSEHQIIASYKAEHNFDEINDDVLTAMTEWLIEHDNSDVYHNLLRHTSNQLLFVETDDYTPEIVEGSDITGLTKKYAKTEGEIKEIRYVLTNQFYSAPVSFYFYLNPLDVYNMIWKNTDKYVLIDGAYFSTIDRVQGSNWLGEKSIFKIMMTRKEFIHNLRMDKVGGYGWWDIAGQTNYGEAGITSSNTKKRGYTHILPTISEEAIREDGLEKHWQDTKKCTYGDMKWERHDNHDYINNYPCGWKCKDCSTFWID